MYVIRVEDDACQSYGLCVDLAPDIFALDVDDMVVLLKARVADEEFDYAEEAVRSCPVNALILEREQ